MVNIGKLSGGVLSILISSIMVHTLFLMFPDWSWFIGQRPWPRLNWHRSVENSSGHPWVDLRGAERSPAETSIATSQANGPTAKPVDLKWLGGFSRWTNPKIIQHPTKNKVGKPTPQTYNLSTASRHADCFSMPSWVGRHGLCRIVKDNRRSTCPEL